MVINSVAFDHVVSSRGVPGRAMQTGIGIESQGELRVLKTCAQSDHLLGV